jgi:hypothetical protein
MSRQQMTDEQQQQEEAMKYEEIRRINVNEYVEKKGNLSYLSWAWAVDQLMLLDPLATWEYRWQDGVPLVKIGDTAMVFCTVTAFGVARTAQLPVMDHKNKPIPEPDAFQVNTAMQRCLAKAIALHGLGLYIYNGEDLPPKPPPEEMAEERRAAIREQIYAAADDVALRKVFKSLPEDERTAMLDDFTARADALRKAA